MERLSALQELTFIEDKHWYRLNGKYIPSVSSFLKPLSLQVYKDIDPSILKIAADRGTEVHLAIEIYETTGADIASEEIRGYVEAYKKFRAATPFLEPIANEYRIYNPTLWYAGTVDALFMNKITSKIVLVDFKTSVAIERSVVIPQLTAYATALRFHGIDVDETTVLHLKPNNTYDFVEIEEDFNIFISCIAIQNHLKKFKKEIKDDGYSY